MTTERTPQDVLREALALVAEAGHATGQAGGPHVTSGTQDWTNCPARGCRLAREALDEAIVEAPDSPPPNPQLCDCNGQGSLYPNEHAFACPMFAAPDTLSEKPGLDARVAETLRRARRAIKPAIGLAKTVEDDDLTALLSDARDQIDDILESGSTDSEGR